MPDTKILVFAGSIRTGALSGKLAALAAKEIALLDTEVTLISLADYPLPLYDGDLEAQKGVPEHAMKLSRLIAAHQGVFIATPEYNHSLPPLLKNTIDWVSRLRNDPAAPWRGKIYGTGSTSDGPIGGARALGDLRRVLAAGWGALVVPERVEVSEAQNAFDESGLLKESRPAAMLRRACDSLVRHARGDGRRL
jgi:NAD(P)H-dependent FMN reductase